MFNSGKQKGTEEISEAPITETNEIDAGDIHTMPNEFISSAPPKSSNKSKWLTIGIVIFLGIGAVIVGAIYFLRQQSKVEPAAIVKSISNETPGVNGAEGNLTEERQNLNTAGLRDAARIKDIADIRTALALYFQTYQIFPTDLSFLTGKFLTEALVNPKPGGRDYVYQPDDDKLNYILTFALEEGGVWGKARLSAGDYHLTPEGVLPGLLPKIQISEGQMPQIPDETQDSQSAATTSPADIAFVPGGGLDTDGDGLTDIEENIYKTDPALADSDGDNYSDSAEILNFYDPNSKTGRLIDSGLTKLYKSEIYNFSLLYPATWAARALSDNEIIFTSSTGEFVSVTVQDNALSQSSFNWYLSKLPNTNTALLKNLVIDGLPAIQSADGLNSYLAVGSKVYIISYNIGAQQQANFKTTYNLFLRSFILIDAD